MVTYERPELLKEALCQVALQDYPGHVHAVVIDDSAAERKLSERSLAELRALLQDLRGSPLDVDYIYLPERMSIGSKRNLATRSTDAEVLCVWDDDDVFTKDRIRKQVLHLQGALGAPVADELQSPVECSGMEVAVHYSVPAKEVCMQSASVPLVFENTLCFTRRWWEERGWHFGEPWEVSGQGEGTLEPWWDDVVPISGAEEPFLYIYLPSSVSGGTALNRDQHPEPDRRLYALVRALSTGRFPEELEGSHVRGVLDGAKAALKKMLQDPNLFTDRARAACSEPDGYAAFYECYASVRAEYLARQGFAAR